MSYFFTYALELKWSVVSEFILHHSGSFFIFLGKSTAYGLFWYAYNPLSE